MSEDEDQGQSKAGSLMSHLVELRDRVVRMVLAVLVLFLGMFYWANDIYVYLAEPLTRHLPEGANMIAIDVASPFLTPFKLAIRSGKNGLQCPRSETATRNWRSEELSNCTESIS